MLEQVTEVQEQRVRCVGWGRPDCRSEYQQVDAEMFPEVYVYAVGHFGTVTCDGTELETV